MSGLVYMVNKIGPKMLPWGTPYGSDDGAELNELMETVNVRLLRYDCISCSAVPVMPKWCCRVWKRIVWSIVSNAADKSRSISILSIVNVFEYVV